MKRLNTLASFTLAALFVSFFCTDLPTDPLKDPGNKNYAPVFADLPNKTTNTQQELVFELSATDADNDPLVFTADLSSLPTGHNASLNATTGAFSWTPAADDAGNYPVTFTVSDGTDSDMVTITISVGDVNRPPVIDPIGNQSVLEAQTLSFTVTVTDPDSDAVTLSADLSKLPAGNNAVFNASNGAFSWTAALGSSGVYHVLVTASAGTLSDTQTVTITVLRPAPVAAFTATPASGKAPLSVSFTNGSTNADSFFWEFGDNGTSTSRNPTHVFQTAGAYTVTLTATGNGSDIATQPVLVTQAHAPVVINIPGQTVNEGAAFAQINLDTYVSDADHEKNQLTWEALGASNLTITINASRMVTVAAVDSEWNGSEIITLQATDPDNLSASDTATFTVIAVNDPPVISKIPAQTIAENTSFATISLDQYVSDPDNADNQISWTAVSLGTKLQASISAARVATIAIKDAAWYGTEKIVFTATDPGGRFAKDTVTFQITYVNDMPVVVNKSILTGRTSSFKLTRSSLLTTDEETTDSTRIVYTITKLPLYGTVYKGYAGTGVQMKVNDTFTQAEVNNGSSSTATPNIQISMSAPSAISADYLEFTVSDGSNSVSSALMFMLY